MYEVTVHVQIGVTLEVVSLGSAILNRQPVQLPAAAEVKEPEAQAPAPAPAARRTKAKKAEESAQAPEPEEPANGTVMQAHNPEPEAPAELPQEEDVRTAMHVTRQRIEGENYKDEPDSEGYKKYHRLLTTEFKNIASLLGAEKPSALPAEKRAAFIKECAQLEVKEDGTIGTKIPF